MTPRTTRPAPGFVARLRRCRRGASAIEFALVAPIFLVMVLGILELGRALWISNTLQYAVEEASRYALVNTDADTADITSYAASVVPGTWDIDEDNFSTNTETDLDGVTYVTITGSYDFTPMVAIVPMSAITLTAQSKVPIS